MTLTETSNTSVTAATSNIEVKIDGSVYSTEATPIVMAEIETSLRMPGMATIAFSDDSNHAAAKDKLKLDSTIEISFSGVGGAGDQKQVAFKGKVAAVEAHREALKAVTVIRCLDGLAKLYGPRLTKTYVKVKYADVVQQVAQRAGLTVGTIESAGPTHDYVIQYEENDGEFLERLAAEYGFVFFLGTDDKFNFVRVPDLSGAPSPGTYAAAGPKQLVFGDDLVNYEVSVGPKAPVSSVKAYGWDIDRKAEIVEVGQLSAARKLADLTNITAAPGNGEFLLSTIPFRTPEGAKITAQGMVDQIAASTVTLRGKIGSGNPFIAAAQPISLGPSDHAFAGKYLVTSARHVYEGGKLTTELACDGLGDRGLTGAGARVQPSAAAPPNTFPWVTIGLVENVKDHGADGTKDLGRVRVKFPHLGLESGTSDWLRVVGHGNGPNRGTWWLPEVGDEVVVVFEHGDMRTGYVLGGLYNGEHKPELGAQATDDGVPRQRGWITTAGHRLLFTDAPDNERAIDLVSCDQKFKLNFAAKDTVLTIDVDGAMVIKLDKANGISITSQKKITVESQQGDIEMKAQNIKLEAQQNIDVKANSNVKVEASMNADLKGGMNATVEGSAQANVKGALVEVSASGINTIKGSLVKIN